MIKFRQEGDFSKTIRYMERLLEIIHCGKLDKYGQEGVAALSSATPIDSGETAASWSYRITNRPGCLTIAWYNSNVDENGCPIAILIQYGHANRDGSHVQGIDYINPALRPIFERISSELWREVTKL